MEKIFVYGTLKKGFGNNRILDNETFVGRDTITGWNMIDLGPFPAIVAGTKHIIGEVWEVNSLQELDLLEGFPSFYDRVQVDTIHGNAWVYVMDDNTMNDTIIETGEWI